MLDFTQARRSMIDSQLRPFDVNDLLLLGAVERVERERFVPHGSEALAYIDRSVVVPGDPESRTVLQPMVMARMIQALDLEVGMTVLDLASGLGYSSAVLAEMGVQVVSMESSETMASEARTRLSGYSNVKVVSGPLDRGWVEAAPYNAILIHGTIECQPDYLIRQLKDGGRLICCSGEGPRPHVTLLVRAGDAIGRRELFDAAAPVIPAFGRKPGFVF